MKQLSQWTRDALLHKADVASDEAGGVDDEGGVWTATEADCRAAVEADTLAGFPHAVEELLDYLGVDMDRAEWRAINADLARAGALERDDPAAEYSGRKPATLTVDGVKYLVGSKH